MHNRSTFLSVSIYFECYSVIWDPFSIKKCEIRPKIPFYRFREQFNPKDIKIDIHFIAISQKKIHVKDHAITYFGNSKKALKIIRDNGNIKLNCVCHILMISSCVVLYFVHKQPHTIIKYRVHLFCP